MHSKLQLTKTTLLTVLLICGTSLASMATAYTAVISGNWSSALTWGGTAPSFNTTGADNITIPLTVTVTQDADVTINNASATLSVAGTLTGTNNLNLTAGTLSGAGTVVVNNLSVGTAGLITSAGTITASQLSNSQATLTILATMNVTNKVVLGAGVLQLGVGGVLNLATNTTINIAGGTFNSTPGLPTLAGTYNLLYTGATSTMGNEVFLGLKDITVNLSSASDVLTQGGDLLVTGTLALQQGVLNMAGNSLNIAGQINTTAGTVTGAGTTGGLVFSGTGSVGTIAFATGASQAAMTVNIAGGGSVSLASDLTVNGILSLTAGSLNLNGHNLNIAGTIGAAGIGTITGSSTSGITLSGTGAVGTLPLGTVAATLGNLTVAITNAGSVLLSSDLTVANGLTLTSGSLDLAGKNLTITGVIIASGTGSISGNTLSNITFSGTGNAGTLVLTPLHQAINNLTMNIGSTGSLALGSPVTVNGAFTLAQGNINTGAYDLTLAATGTLTGGSSASYVVTSDTGHLIMTVANAGANSIFQVGTLLSYAPVTVTNNSTILGKFNVRARQGVLLNGATGTDISQFQPVVNTSWEVGSSIATGTNVDLLMGWNISMQVNGFDNTQAYVSHFTAGAWNTSTVTAATVVGGGAFSLALTGVTSFSPFAVFGKDVALGIADVKSDNMQIYPNPVSDKLTIQTGTTSAQTSVEITDLSGKMVAHFELSNGDNAVSVANLNTGSYIIKVSNSQMNSIKKFVKI